MDLNQRGDHQEALRIAQLLSSYRYTGAWEVEAVALYEMGDTDGAIEILKGGIAKMPVWRNGHLLGIYLSDEGRYNEALQAFEASLAMHDPQPKMTAYNQAIVLNRMGRTGEAIALLKSLKMVDSEEAQAMELASAFLDRLIGDIPAQPTRRRRPVRMRSGTRRAARSTR